MFQRLAHNVEQYMNVLSARQKLVASNIANADTPDYKTRDVNFQSEFTRAMAEEGAAPRPADVEGLLVKNDGNNVSLEREARLLAENALRFTLATNLARGEVKAIRTALDDGRNG